MEYEPVFLSAGCGNRFPQLTGASFCISSYLSAFLAPFGKYGLYPDTRVNVWPMCPSLLLFRILILSVCSHKLHIQTWLDYFQLILASVKRKHSLRVENGLECEFSSQIAVSALIFIYFKGARISCIIMRHKNYYCLSSARRCQSSMRSYFLVIFRLESNQPEKRFTNMKVLN